MSNANRWLRRAAWTLAAIVLVVVLIAAGGVYWLHRAMVASLPTVDGNLKVSGPGGPVLSSPVTVRRDGHGVPHLEAASLDDLLLAQGYVTAQDRLWQMDSLRRNTGGELAEILGPALVAHDKAERVFQFRSVAARIFASMPEQDRHRYEQYARGVNLYIEQNRDRLPVEFRLLRYQPKPWTGADCILVGLNMVQSLDNHWETKLGRERVSAKLHDPKLEADLYPVGSWRDHPPSAAMPDMTEPHPAPQPDDEDSDQTETRLSQPAGMSGTELRKLRETLGLSPCEGCASGSNNWVISGKHTASGKPLLSNDMHLGLSVPNIWYMAELKAPGLHVAGVTLPGVPLVIAGHNDHVAWGFTALYADVQDLYVEKLDGKGNYAGPNGEWLPLAHTQETIHVRFGADIPLDVQITAHGPLLNPILHGETRPIALRWSLYDPALAQIPLYEINTAQNWTQFSAALGAWCFPTQNVVYADDAGHIAYHAVGKVPARPTGLAAMPILPSKNGDMGHEWMGYIPFDNLPNQVDPASGLLATANSRVTPNDSEYPLTLDWAEPYRAERIYMDLRGRDKLTRADMLAVQTDIYSEMDQELAHRFAYAIDHTAGVDKRLQQAADLLRSWDGRMSVDSPAASIVYRARQAFWPLVLEPKLGSDMDAYTWSESIFAEEEIIMHGSADLSAPSRWLPANYKDWDALLTEAVRRGLAEGKAPSDLAKWKYGSWHVVDLEHPLFERMPLVKSWWGTGALPLSGDTTTIKQVGRAFGPSQRFTMDWSDRDGSTENIVLGESGDGASPWFRDQWSAWYGGTTFALPFTPEAVSKQTAHTLQLVP